LFKDAQASGVKAANAVQISCASPCFRCKISSFLQLNISLLQKVITVPHVVNIKKIIYAIWLHSGFHGIEEGINQHWLKSSMRELGFNGFSL